jgi:hypothetical protein
MHGSAVPAVRFRLSRFRRSIHSSPRWPRESVSDQEESLMRAFAAGHSRFSFGCVALHPHAGERPARVAGRHPHTGQRAATRITGSFGTALSRPQSQRGDKIGAKHGVLLPVRVSFCEPKKTARRATPVPDFISGGVGRNCRFGQALLTHSSTWLCTVRRSRAAAVSREAPHHGAGKFSARNAEVRVLIRFPCSPTRRDRMSGFSPPPDLYHTPVGYGQGIFLQRRRYGCRTKPERSRS